MRLLLSILLLASGCFYAAAQKTMTSKVDITRHYSPNKAYYLESIPYSNIDIITLGKSTVYRASDHVALYSINRYFYPTINPNLLYLSNNGQNISYYYPSANDNKPGHESLSFYNNGNLIKTYTAKELTGCKGCELLYYNNAIFEIDKDTRKYVIKPGTDSVEAAAVDKHIFTYNDTLYIINRDKKLQSFSSLTGQLINTMPYDSSAYLFIAKRYNQTYTTKEIKDNPKFAYKGPQTKDGKTIEEHVADGLNLYVFDDHVGNKEYKYKSHYIWFSGIIDSTGHIKVVKLDCDTSYFSLPEVTRIIESTEYSTQGMPAWVSQWYLDEIILNFRDKSAAKAKKEKVAEDQEQVDRYNKNIVADSINGHYIPKNLADCFSALDSICTPELIKEIKELPNKEATVKHHFGVGLWMRNNWGLWGGSRLGVYFNQHGIYHPDDMSSIILQQYYLYLHGDKNGVSNWENEHPVVK